MHYRNNKLKFNSSKEVKKELQNIIGIYKENMDLYNIINGNINNAINTAKSIEQKIINNKEDLYSYVRVDEIKKLSSESALTSLKMIGVDGATDYIRPTINKMSEEDFEIYKNYQLSICERPELLGASSHLMEILRK